jgi:hypothetical protein
MRYLLFGVALLLGLCGAVRSAEIPEVSLIQLIASPERYDGKRIMVQGFALVEFEGNALYLHKEDKDFGLSKNAIWLEVPEEKEASWKLHSGSYVLVVGTFRAANRGHWDMFSGAIEGIIRFESLNRRPAE